MRKVGKVHTGSFTFYSFMNLPAPVNVTIFDDTQLKLALYTVQQLINSVQ